MRDLFLRAAALPRAQRQAFLERVCGSDKALLKEVLDLLRYHPEEPAPTGKLDVRLKEGGALAAAAELGLRDDASGGEGGGSGSAAPARGGDRGGAGGEAGGVVVGGSGVAGRGSSSSGMKEPSKLPMPSRSPADEGGDGGVGAMPVTEAKYGAVPATIDHGPFPPGHLIQGRYRIVERIGRGGMGVVYRADDLTLNQPVALKFLPEAFAEHPSRKARFLNEARVSLQITHPNVCRVHDIVEVDGRQFLSMEYVGGEDLGSLLKRVGRPHVERAIGLAQQMCRGLHAAHEKGVLHRDLKPANVMVDDDGNAKILDFGLAGMAAGISGIEVKAGTPTYMAPEQLRGDAVTVRSDVYGLGLLLYELFTGKKAWEASSIPELMHMHRKQLPPDPRELVPGLDERIARTIMACLARDPEERPKSAMAVAAMLPGGDPLAAALAAGETPSPQVVAQAGGRGVLRPAYGIGLMASVVGLLAVVAWLAPRVAMQDKAYLNKGPAVLASIAENCFARLGYSLQDQHTASALDYYEELVSEIERNDKGLDRWDRLGRPRPAAIDFWYRASPMPLRPQNSLGKVTMTDPAPTEPGMISLRLSPAGQLRELFVRYRDADDMTTPDGWRPPSVPSDLERTWRLLFELADLPFDEFVSVEPMRVPPVFADTRAAWEGVYPESPEIEVRVEAATYRGQAVAFRLIEKRWPKASQVGVPEELFRRGPGLWATTGMTGLLVIASLVLVPGNVFGRRVDYMGAFKVGIGGTGLWCIGWWLRASHVWTLQGEMDLLGRAAGQSLLVGAALVVFYMAMEPYVRRQWPQMLISWERLLSGRVRDALVGKHALVGVLLGVGSATAFYATLLIPSMVGKPPPAPFMDGRYGMDAMMSARSGLGAVLHMSVASVREGMALVLVLVIVRFMVKRTWMAAGVFAILTALFWGLMSGSGTTLTWPVLGVVAGALAFVVVRYGLLSAAIAAMVYHLLVAFPLTIDPSMWYFDATIFAHSFVVVSALIGVLLATGVVRATPDGVAPVLSASRH
ncbi:MAG: serine/threonine protein kinase [Phycisphaeraceae bacterium]|nr:serine/threonine protein kinase [Phycisphaeraceae bacterium]